MPKKTPSRNDGDFIDQVMARLLFFETSLARLSSGLIVSKKLETSWSSMILYTLHYRGLVYAFCYRYADHPPFLTQLRPYQIAVSDINKFAFAVEGAETISHSISRYATLEQIYLRYDTTATRAIKGLEEALVRLYATVLIYLAKTKRYFEEPTPSRPCSRISPIALPNFSHRTHG